MKPEILDSPSASLKDERVQERTKKRGNAEDLDDPRETDAIREIDDAIVRCRGLLQNPLISDRTRREYDRMFEELRAERNVGWMRQNVSLLAKTIGKAQSYKEKFTRQLNEAVRNKWISTESKEKWWNRFNDPNLLELERKSWIEDDKGSDSLKGMMDRWKAVAEKRAEVEKLAKEKGITAKDIPELNDVLNVEAFLSFHYQTRVHKVAKVRSLILAHKENKTTFITFIEAELEGAVSAGYMHTSKVGEWMERVMDSKEPEKFAAKVLYPFMKNWREVKADFDRLNDALDRQGIPRGFRPVNATDFLLMDYKKRTSYCAFAWLQLEDSEGEYETDKRLSALKLQIRYHLNEEDWEMAEDKLGDAEHIRSDDRELQSMREYLKCHRVEEQDDAKEPLDPNALQKDMRTMVDMIPDNKTRAITSKALTEGPAVFARWKQTMYNLVWLHEVARWSDQDVKQRIDLVRTTKNQPKKGHFIDIESMEPDEVIREVRLHADENAGKTPPNLSADEHWGYWANAVTSMPYPEHRAVVKGINWKLMRNLRSLHKSGHRYTETEELKAEPEEK